MTVGLPASGKSTWAKALVLKEAGRWVRVNKDSLREMCHSSKFSKSNEKFVVRLRNLIILEALADGKNVIVDDTNLHPKHIRAVTELVKGEAVVEINDSFLSVPVETCIRRDLGRVASVGKDVIMQMYKEFIAPNAPPPVHDPDLADVIVVDMDGTLALLGNRSPYDASRCDRDQPNLPVLQTILKWQETHKIIVMSGRTDDARVKTEAWLATHGVKYEALHMRAFGDMRKDTVVKQEMYNQHLAGKVNVIAVFDDRASVVEMWRRLGLTVFQVAEGNF
ncbi:MAG: polynucleotide kinase [Phormidesmis priestleyi]|uniref:Polynucleotide kinase n=1 Tax=Phormidesmis priestleyi TaxID=268141 RepID=A0A2W4XT53_9CYAN|nr:MAG: polynucleotide kinase [Phormidesmis priestleyi]